MSKRCPSCGYSPIGPFTDNCPICAEPVRNVRSSGGGGGGYGFGRPNSLMKLVVGGVIVAFLGVAGCCGLSMWKFGNAIENAQKEMEKQKAAAEADRKARTVSVSAAEFLKEFQADTDAADRKYVGKYLEISGVVENSGVDRFNSPFVVVHGGDENAKFKIECFFDNLLDHQIEARVRRLVKGQAISLRGEYDGRITNVQLRECVLAN